MIVTSFVDLCPFCYVSQEREKIGGWGCLFCLFAWPQCFTDWELAEILCSLKKKCFTLTLYVGIGEIVAPAVPSLPKFDELQGFSWRMLTSKQNSLLQHVLDPVFACGRWCLSRRRRSSLTWRSATSLRWMSTSRSRMRSARTCPRRQSWLVTILGFFHMSVEESNMSWVVCVEEWVCACMCLEQSLWTRFCAL